MPTRLSAQVKQGKHSGEVDCGHPAIAMLVFFDDPPAKTNGVFRAFGVNLVRISQGWEQSNRTYSTPLRFCGFGP